MDHVEATCDRLRGATIYLDFPSAGTTTHLMSTATLAQGTTYIENAALEPEVVDVAEFLTTLGAKISGAGTKSIAIEGVAALHGGEFRVREDRIEAATYAVAAAATGGDVSLDFATLPDIGPVLSKLSAAGCEVREEPFGVRVKGPARCRAVDVKTMPHPGFPTDVQQPFTALMTCCEGTAIVTETVYEWRFKQVGELIRMGADIKMEGESAIIKGVPRLHGTEVTATDLRAGAALVIAGLAAEGETRIVGVEHIERGYQDMIAKLAGLGAIVAKFDEARQVDLCLA
jgi:UDP-N-acetylglucosamine 1-carboxyvinyltransferase